MIFIVGFPVDGYPNTHSVTGLIIAIRRSDLLFIQTLVELGCDVNCSVRSYTIIPLIEAYQICKNKQENFFLFEVNSWYVYMNESYNYLFFFLFFFLLVNVRLESKRNIRISFAIGCIAECLQCSSYAFNTFDFYRWKI